MHGLVQLDSPPTALFTSHYLVTLGAIRALHDLHLEQQVALIGFDDIALADLVRPAVTVMAPDPTQIGTIAAERLFATRWRHLTRADRRRPGAAHPPRFWRDPTAGQVIARRRTTAAASKRDPRERSEQSTLQEQLPNNQLRASVIAPPHDGGGFQTPRIARRCPGRQRADTLSSASERGRQRFQAILASGASNNMRWQLLKMHALMSTEPGTWKGCRP